MLICINTMDYGIANLETGYPELDSAGSGGPSGILKTDSWRVLVGLPSANGLISSHAILYFQLGFFLFCFFQHKFAQVLKQCHRKLKSLQCSSKHCMTYLPSTHSHENCSIQFTVIDFLIEVINSLFENTQKHTHTITHTYPHT